MRKISKYDQIRLKILLGIIIFVMLAVTVSLTGHPRLFWLSLLCLVIIFVFNKNFKQNGEIYSNKIALIPYCIVYSFMMIYCIMVVTNMYSIFNLHFDSFKLISKSLFIIVLIITLYIFKIGLKSFKWNITIKQFIIVIVLAVIVIIALHSDAKSKINFISVYHYDIKSYGKFALYTVIFTACFEELLFRGVIMAGLKGIGIGEEKANLLQCILYAIPHFPAFMTEGCPLYFALVLTSAQLITGYVYGRLYLKTKSLTPGIILHLLIDLI